MVVFKLPICNGSYTNVCDVADVDFIINSNVAIRKSISETRPFFAGLCYNNLCLSPGTTSKPLQRCGGCQLVAYCSKECQKANWTIHKYVCKEFPVVDGKNVLQTSGSWKEHIAGLRDRAARISHAEVAALIFRNPRVCHTCREAQSDRLTDCKCSLISYCSKRCAQGDIKHEEDCPILDHIGHYYSCEDDKRPYILPSLSDIPVYDIFIPVSSWDDLLTEEYKTELFTLVYLKQQKYAYMESDLANERLSYSMSLLYALQTLPERRLGRHHRPLEDLTTLDVHVITSIPLLDSEHWEFFMHRLPNLKQLNVVLVMQGREFRQSFGFISMSLERCSDCENKDRVITHSVHQMLYHMYFSLPEYTEPDVVVIYGNKHEMTASEDDVIHSEISYRNMTSSPHTVLVLMDETVYMVLRGKKDVNAARPVDQLVNPQRNLMKGYSTNWAQLDSKNAIINEKSYFTCLRSK